MKITATKTHLHHVLKHETKLKVLLKFSLVLLLFLGYLGFITIKFGLADGFLVTLLTWSFFVLCTPIADAGFLLDFPLRLITNIRMFYSELVVWTIAISLNIYAFFVHPELYNKTSLLILFKHILEVPIPFWSIILVSAVGTFLSIRFGDELLDKVNHRDCTLYKKHKRIYRYLIVAMIIILTVVLYDFLLRRLGINLLFY